MEAISINKDKAIKKYKSALTACGFLIAHYVYIVCYNLVDMIRFDLESSVIAVFLMAPLVALFIWLLRRAKSTISLSTIAAIFLTYFGERVFSITALLADGDYWAVVIQLIVCVPILFFIFQGVRSAIDLRALDFRDQQQA